MLNFDHNNGHLLSIRLRHHKLKQNSFESHPCRLGQRFVRNSSKFNSNFNETFTSVGLLSEFRIVGNGPKTAIPSNRTPSIIYQKFFNFGRGLESELFEF